MRRKRRGSIGGRRSVEMAAWRHRGAAGMGRHSAGGANWRRHRKATNGAWRKRQHGGGRAWRCGGSSAAKKGYRGGAARHGGEHKRQAAKMASKTGVSAADIGGQRPVMAGGKGAGHGGDAVVTAKMAPAARWRHQRDCRQMLLASWRSLGSKHRSSSLAACDGITLRHVATSARGGSAAGWRQKKMSSGVSARQRHRGVVNNGIAGGVSAWWWRAKWWKSDERAAVTTRRYRGIGAHLSLLKSSAIRLHLWRRQQRQAIISHQLAIGGGRSGASSAAAKANRFRKASAAGWRSHQRKSACHEAES